MSAADHLAAIQNGYRWEEDEEGGLVVMGTRSVPMLQFSPAALDDPEAVELIGDLYLDLVGGEFQPAKIVLLQADFDGSGKVNRKEGEIGLVPHDIVVADFNRDGREDLATAHEQTDSVSILLGLGGGDVRPLRHVPPRRAPPLASARPRTSPGRSRR